MQDRDITRRQLKGRRLFDATKARPAKWLWTLQRREHTLLYRLDF
jgi:hypothetical protein